MSGRQTNIQHKRHRLTLFEFEFMCDSEKFIFNIIFLWLFSFCRSSNSKNSNSDSFIATILSVWLQNCTYVLCQKMKPNRTTETRTHTIFWFNICCELRVTDTVSLTERTSTNFPAILFYSFTALDSVQLLWHTLLRVKIKKIAKTLTYFCILVCSGIRAPYRAYT